MSAAASQRRRWICCFRPATPESEHEVQQLQRILPRLQRSLGIPTERARSRKPEQLDLVLPRPTCSVEQAVREHLTRPDAPVYYVENARRLAVRPTLLGRDLRAVAGRVLSPVPLGAGRPEPRGLPPAPRRSVRRLPACLDSDDYRDCIWRTFRAKLGIHNAFVTWGLLDEQLLAQALDCIPAAHLKLLFQRIRRTSLAIAPACRI